MKLTSIDQLKSKHRFADYVYWCMFFLIHVVTGFIAIVKHSVVWSITYVVIGIALVALVYRFQCTHCPHYVEGKKRTKCMFFWGVPKFFRARPGPLSFFEKTVPFIAGIIWVFFPLYWLLLEPDLFILYWLSLIVLFLTIWRHECTRCIYFNCPMNRVPEDVQRQFQSE